MFLNYGILEGLDGCMPEVKDLRLLAKVDVGVFEN